METVTLNYKTLGNGPKDLVILHGLFGSLDNWMTLAKQWAKDYTIWLLDQRNHGRSPHHERWDYPSMAADLDQFLKDHAIEHPVLLGHSMGGKTVMQFLQDFAGKASAAIIVDMAPKYYAPHHGIILKGFEAVHVEEINSRQEADERMSSIIESPPIRMFLLKNLTREKDGYAWKPNLEVIKENIEEVGRDTLPDKAVELPVLFVRGERSDYINKGDFEQIKSHFPNAQMESISGAGHWIHAEKPKVLYSVVKEFVDSIG